MLTNWRCSKFFRTMAFLILLNFLISQNTFAQEEFRVQEGTHRYTPVKEVSADRLEVGGSDKGTPPSESLPNPIGFWNQSPLSSAMPEIEVVHDFGTTYEYASDFYSFDQALDLIRPKFAAAGSMAKNGTYGF